MDHIRDYGQDAESAKQFLRDFTYVDEEGELIHKYAQMLTKLANREERLMVVDMADLERFNQDLAKHVALNALRYTNVFYEALDELLPAYKTKDNPERDVMDVFIDQRLKNLAAMNQSKENRRPAGLAAASQDATDAVKDIDNQYPPELIRRAELCFKPASLKSIPIREVKAEHIGKLVTIRGIVTRVTDVKPKLTIACYSCQQCGCETFQPVSGYEFTPLFECTSAICKANKTLGRLTFRVRGSKFTKYQEIKLQEHSDQVPVGHIPRMATVMAHGEQARSCAPGDHVSISGVFLTIEKYGFRFRTGGLSAETYVEAHYITQMNKTEDDEIDNAPMPEAEARALMSQHPDFMGYLSASLAPEIFGHNQLKKALLLLLVGGVDRSPDGMKIRGNINICLMGDPGVAKSQMLGFIDRLASRSQYTTGRGSSGVGLTAAVMKDPITNELSLEGGALVLADQGICCIDEFDKMMDADRTAIHEVMEQQTVSIAKAGIMTTLNARVSILAAANPAFGRWDSAKSVSDNLQLPPALLSRFDLIWLIKDKPQTESDIELARHITNVHREDKAMRTFDNVMSIKDMRRFINLCKLKNPVVPEGLAREFVNIYLGIRREKRESEKRNSQEMESEKRSMFTSPRSLLAIIRMSTALARLRLADQVENSDVERALALYTSSRESIDSAAASGRPEYQLILDYLDEARGGELSCSFRQLSVLAAEYDEETLRKILEQLEKVGMVALDEASDSVIKL